MSGIPADYQTLWLNGSRYAVISQVSEDNASEFAATINQTNPMYDQRNPPVSTFTMDSWTGGLGIKWADFREDQGRFWDSSGVDTRFANQLTLGPLVTTDLVTVGDSLTVYDRASYLYFNGVEYFGLGDKIWSWTASGGEVEVKDVSTAEVLSLGKFTNSSNVQTAYAFLTTAQALGTAFYTSTDGSTWTQGTNTLGISCLEFDNHLIIFGGTDLVTQIDTSDVGDGALASYTTLFTFGTAANASGIPRRGIIFRNAAGEFVPYVVIARSASQATGAQALGQLYVMDYYARKLSKVGVPPFRMTLNDQTGMAVWNNDLYYADSHGSILKFGVDSYEDIGLNRDQGVPAALGSYVAHLMATARWLYAVTATNDVGSGGSGRLLAYNGIGWHPIIDGFAGGGVRGAWASEAVPGRILVVNAGATGTGAQIDYISEATIGDNPINDTSYTYIAGGYLITPWYDLGFADLDKTLLSMTIDGQDIDATETVVVSYQINGIGPDDFSSGNTTLGTFDSDGEIIKFGTADANSNYPGVAVKNVRFKIALARAAGTNTLSPKVRALTLRYIVNVPYRFASQFIIDIGKTIEIRGAPFAAAEDIMDELKATFNTDPLVDYRFGNDSTTRKVKMVTLPFRTYETVDGSRDGTVQVQVLQPLAD